MRSPNLVVRALRTVQAGTDVYMFFAPGRRILEIADLARLGPGVPGDLVGFQRPEIRSHVRAIVDYLDRGDVLFPNAIILALAPGAKFSAVRGTKPAGLAVGGEAGTLEITASPGRKAGWVVDGQQRSLALSETDGADLSVPVVAFVSGDLSIQREQFILVNKARPLSPRLIDELLPHVGSVLPRDLTSRRIPSALCNALNTSADSPFHGLVKRPSSSDPQAVIADSSLVRMMRRSIQDPRGALAAHVGADGTADADAMFATLVVFWGAVRDAFPEAWGHPPERSRLMHAAGIEAMGVLMDQVMTRTSSVSDGGTVRSVLDRIAPACRWTSGRWDGIQRDWNDVQCTPRDVRLLSNLLIGFERDASRAVAA